MGIIVFFLLGIMCEVATANAWLNIPNYVPYILFVSSGVLFGLNIVDYFLIKHRINKMHKKLKK